MSHSCSLTESRGEVAMPQYFPFIDYVERYDCALLYVAPPLLIFRCVVRQPFVVGVIPFPLREAPFAYSLISFLIGIHATLHILYAVCYHDLSR